MPVATDKETNAELAYRIDVDNGTITGKVAPNGAAILLARPSQRKPVSRNVRSFIVLCLSHGEFVTWALDFDMSTEDRRECWMGHYFGGDLKAALADYEVRDGTTTHVEGTT